MLQTKTIVNQALTAVENFRRWTKPGSEVVTGNAVEATCNNGADLINRPKETALELADALRTLHIAMQHKMSGVSNEYVQDVIAPRVRDFWVDFGKLFSDWTAVTFDLKRKEGPLKNRLQAVNLFFEHFVTGFRSLADQVI